MKKTSTFLFILISSLLRAQLGSYSDKLKLNYDSILVARFIELENTNIMKEDGDMEYDKINGGNVIYASDSILKAVNLYGEYSGGATFNPYSLNYVLKNDKIIKTSVIGNVFRIDNINSKDYLFYADDYGRLGSDINVYKISLISDSIISQKTDSFGNYYYDFIANKVELSTDLPSFNSIIWNNENVLYVLKKDTSIMEPNEYYSWGGDFFWGVYFYSSEDSKNLHPDFYMYYRHKYGDEISKYLRVTRSDTVFDILLACQGGDSWCYSVSTEFMNDSIFKKINIQKETIIDDTHIMAYATDSIITIYNYDKDFNFIEIKKDSFHIYNEFPIFHKELKDSIFKTWSLPFTINGIFCQWEYGVKYTDEIDKNAKEMLVNLIYQKLIFMKSKECILELDSRSFPYRALSIAEFEHHEYELDREFDINFDGYTDFQFTDRTQGGANHEYFVYLYNPTLKRFEYSKELTGSSMADNGIELDKKNKIAYYSANAGSGLYGFRRVYFNQNGTVNYEEIFWNKDLEDSDKYAFNYLKSKNGITLDSLRVIRVIENNGLESVYQPFFDWMESFK